MAKIEHPQILQPSDCVWNLIKIVVGKNQRFDVGPFEDPIGNLAKMFLPEIQIT